MSHLLTFTMPGIIIIFIFLGVTRRSRSNVSQWVSQWCFGDLTSYSKPILLGHEFSWGTVQKGTEGGLALSREQYTKLNIPTNIPIQPNYLWIIIISAAISGEQYTKLNRLFMCRHLLLFFSAQPHLLLFFSSHRHLFLSYDIMANIYLCVWKQDMDATKAGRN